MTTLLILFILIGLGLYGVKEYYQIKLDVTPKTTSTQATRIFVEIIGTPPDQDDPGGRILEIGSGFGGFVLNTARQLPAWQLDGLEQNPTLWVLSNLRSIGKNLGNYRFFLDDFTTWPLRNYDVIFINQPDKVLRRWEASIARRLPVGTVLVCLNGRLPRVKPVNTIPFDGNNTFYVYQKRVAETVPPPITDNIEQPYNIDQAAPDFNPPDLPEPQPELPLDNPPEEPQPAVPGV